MPLAQSSAMHTARRIDGKYVSARLNRSARLQAKWRTVAVGQHQSMGCIAGECVSARLNRTTRLQPLEPQ